MGAGASAAATTTLGSNSSSSNNKGGAISHSSNGQSSSMHAGPSHGQKAPAHAYALHSGSIWTPPARFRPAGSPAGSHPHTPWHVCVLHDPYERVNFWSHFLPGVAFLVIGFLAYARLIPGAATLALFCVCATATHLLSALTHVWPDDHALEKCDHIGIVALIAGTPLTAAMAMRPGGNMSVMVICTVALLGAAAMRPTPRTILFVLLGATLFFSYFFIVNLNLCVQVTLYLLGAAFFLRNRGHDRWTGWTDHHLLHYFVTAACTLHVWYIISARKQAIAAGEAAA